MSDGQASSGGMRLQKFLSRAGVASRRHSERMIEEGRVSVDGAAVTELGTRVRPGEQVVRVDGRRVEISRRRWIALHKPAGYLTARMDDRGRRTVYELVPDELEELFHVGRLDRESEGLLILTNDGDVAHRLLHPSYQVPRRYVVEVEGGPGEAEVRRHLEAGVQLEDGPARAEDVRVEHDPGQDTRRIHLTVREGRKREIRRMMDELNLPVRRLVRTAFGPVQLGELEPGKWRDLEEPEVRALRRAVGLEGTDGYT